MAIVSTIEKGGLRDEKGECSSGRRRIRNVATRYNNKCTFLQYSHTNILRINIKFHDKVIVIIPNDDHSIFLTTTSKYGHI